MPPTSPGRLPPTPPPSNVSATIVLAVKSLLLVEVVAADGDGARDEVEVEEGEELEEAAMSEATTKA